MICKIHIMYSTCKLELNCILDKPFPKKISFVKLVASIHGLVAAVFVSDAKLNVTWSLFAKLVDIGQEYTAVLLYLFMQRFHTIISDFRSRIR